MGLFKMISNYFNEMDQATHNKLIATTGSLITIYSLHKIDLKIRTNLVYLLNGSILLLITLALVVLILHRKHIWDYFRNINYRELRRFLVQNGLLVAVFVLILFGFFYLREDKSSSYDLRNNVNVFRLGDSFVDIKSSEDTRIYLDENYTELTSQFNDNLKQFIKSLNKKLTQRVKLTKLKDNNETNSNETISLESNQNYIDLEFVYLFNYLNKTLPLFLKNQTYIEQIENEESLIETIASIVLKLVYVMIFVSVTSYIALKLIHRSELDSLESNLSFGKKLTSPPKPTVLKDSSCQTEFDMSKEASQSLLEINRTDTRSLKPVDIYGSKTLLSNSASVITLTEQQQQQQEEEFLKYKILKELSDDASSHLLNWILFLGLDNFLNDTKTNVTSNLRLNQTKLLNKLTQNLKSTKQQLKFDDIYFKNVDTLPPKFTNIQTVVNSVENLTLRANVEFPNIDMKVEFKKSKRLLDLKMTSAKAQLLIVLSQNKNHVFSLECSLDQNSDLLMTFEKNQNIEPELMQYFETLIQTAVKQTILNLELNSLNKSTPSFAMPTKSIRTTNKPMAPQINQNFVSPQTAGTVNTATATSPTSAQAPPLNQTSAASSATNSPAKTPYNTYDLPIFTNKQTSPSPAPATAPTTPQSRANIINNLLQNNNNAANLNTNAEFNNNNNIETVNLIESNVQARSYEEEEIQFQPAQLLLKPQQQQSQQQNENAFESEVNNIQALAAAAAAANAKQLRNSVNEKRLLVKLLKATNLTNCDEPYIVVELDYPMQKHITDIHRDMSSINEQFFFDIIANSEELTFSIFDRAKDYGNDLVGEAVIPVNDLCSSLSAKRVIQLHRYGQTKTGSITAEFVFIEPSAQADQNEPRLMRVPAPRVRNSSSPFDQLRSTLSPEKRILYRDDLLMPQQIDQYQQKTNPDQLADSEYPSPRSPLYNENTFNRTMDALYTNPMMQAQQQQEQPQNMHRSRQQQPMTPQPRVINRNYLQTQAHNRAKTLDPRGSNDFVKDEAVAGASNDVPLNTLDKRKRSISRSLKSLLNKSTNKLFGHKREKSYDVANTVEAEPYDTQSVDNNKKVSNSIKKLFDSKKPKNPEVEYNQNAPRPGSSGGPAISISRPDDSMLINNQLHYYPNATNEYYMQPTNNMNMNSQIDNSNNFSNNLTDDTYNTTQPVLLRRSYRLP